MGEFNWVLHNAEGTELRTTEPFGSKVDAEAWMGTEWAELLGEGAESVSLIEDGKTLYRMSLREA